MLSEGDATLRKDAFACNRDKSCTMSAATSQLNELLAKAAGLRSAPENVSADIKSATVQVGRPFLSA
jgi:hypothetical protein